MTAQLVQHSSDTSPSGKVTYSIWVWSTVAARHVSASAISTHAMLAPRFTLCPVSHGRTCSIGALPANQAVELMVTDQVRSTATIGSPITLAVTVAGASLSPAEAAVTTVVGQPGQGGTPSPAPVLPPTTLIPIPGATITPDGLTGLFPTVTPAPSPSRKSTHQARRLAGITQTSSALPLDPRLIGGQLAGLAVLAAAITMVVARLSLRTPQTSGAVGSSQGGSSPGGSSPGGPGTGGPGTGESGPGESGTGESGTGESGTADAGTGEAGKKDETSGDKPAS
jgi:hypothetical protein